MSSGIAALSRGTARPGTWVDLPGKQGNISTSGGSLMTLLLQLKHMLKVEEIPFGQAASIWEMAAFELLIHATHDPATPVRLIQWRGCSLCHRCCMQWVLHPQDLGMGPSPEDVGHCWDLPTDEPLMKKSRHQAQRFHFSEAIEKNPSEQKPTKVFESPVTQNH